MSKWIKRLLVTVVILAGAYYTLVVYSPSAGTQYSIDIAKVRALANSIPGDKPLEIRYEHIMDFRFAEAMVVAGDPWKWTPISVYSWQLVYPDNTVIVDAAMNREIAEPEALVPMYSDSTYLRMQQALEKASQIVITHEHMDHIGGLAAHPHLAALLPALKLTEEQFNNRKGMEPSVLPEDVVKDYKPIKYDGMMALAPGVVLIKSPGHTPGSQMVYVQRADGRELLLLGDVSWHMRNIELVRERPLFMTLVIGENRSQVVGEFQALHDLQKAEPTLKLVPGHDGAVVRELLSEGLVTPGFKL
ncbi:MBL fold metallo-hydrolase [Stenotrophobium rhamnosiphilum]|uniref:MBL fold metallo-hydrolase n=1 Tax=Stenotrophobium rhamnosiphilum TaxID=2029166 RepID=A0A2T5MK61_9GAMM|nr:MBL fold metallo-hydrolase [Stenotrophobium rhamnosiphilum]PTU32977.1 MBL fold metallo-hydrolase [Stenotrophobium rhamnosiphilum]